jgi:membrane protein implicated in regulation of membrane protease activity
MGDRKSILKIDWGGISKWIEEDKHSPFLILIVTGAFLVFLTPIALLIFINLLKQLNVTISLIVSGVILFPFLIIPFLALYLFFKRKKQKHASLKENKRFIGDKGKYIVHDINKERLRCEIDNIKVRDYVYFDSDEVDEAIKKGFKKCGFCLEGEREIIEEKSQKSKEELIKGESQIKKIETHINIQQANLEYKNALTSLYTELKNKLRFLKVDKIGTLGTSDVNTYKYVKIFRESNIPFKAYIYEFWKDAEEFYKQYDEYLMNLKKFLDTYENTIYSILIYYFNRKKFSPTIVNIGKEFEELESQHSLRHPRYLSSQIIVKIIPPLMRNESIDYSYLDDNIRKIITSDYGDIKEIWEKIRREYSDLYDFHHSLIERPNYNEIVFEKREILIKEAQSIIDKILKKIYGIIFK